MLSPTILDKCTHSYRKGYLDGYFGNKSEYTQPNGSFKPFGQFDYDEGYQAGKSDARTNIMPLSERRKLRRELVLEVVREGYEANGLTLKTEKELQDEATATN